MTRIHLLIPRLAVLALALLGSCVTAHAQTLEGMLERGPTHTVLWTISPESGDLIGQVVANTSQAGQIILAQCLPGLHCVAERASIAEPPASVTDKLAFSTQPSGWLLITKVHGARMAPSLPMREGTLATRHGHLVISDDYQLQFNGQPVLAPPTQTVEPAVQADPAPKSAPLTFPEKVSTWLRGWWSQLRDRLLALMGRTHPQAEPTMSAALPANTGEPVQGNSALHIVAHFELNGKDVVLLQDTGGAACPALYRFVTLTPQGVSATSEFGTCSDIATVQLSESPNGVPEPLVTMNGMRGPFEPEEEQRRAHMQLHRFMLSKGQVQELAQTR